MRTVTNILHGVVTDNLTFSSLLIHYLHGPCSLASFRINFQESLSLAILLQPLTPVGPGYRSRKSNKYYIFWGCVCSLRYPACKVHAPYCHLWPAALYNIFHFLINGLILEKKVTEHKTCVSSFSTTFVWNISHSKKNWARYDEKCILVFVYSAFYSCPILMKL